MRVKPPRHCAGIPGNRSGRHTPRRWAGPPRWSGRERRRRPARPRQHDDAGGGQCGGGGGESYDAAPPSSTAAQLPRGTADELRAALFRLDGKPYPAYHDVENIEYDMGRFSLVVQKVQSDPFAPPSKCYVRVPLTEAAFPPHCFAPPIRAVALRGRVLRNSRSSKRA